MIVHDLGGNIIEAEGAELITIYTVPYPLPVQVSYQYYSKYYSWVIPVSMYIIGSGHKLVVGLPVLRSRDRIRSTVYCSQLQGVVFFRALVPALPPSLTPSLSSATFIGCCSVLTTLSRYSYSSITNARQCGSIDSK